MNWFEKLITADVPAVFVLLLAIGCAALVYFLIKSKKREIALERLKIEAEVGKVYSQKMNYDLLREKYELYKKFKGNDDDFIENAVSGLERRLAFSKTPKEVSELFEGFSNCHIWGNVFDKIHQQLALKTTATLIDIVRITLEQIPELEPKDGNPETEFEEIQALIRKNYFTTYFQLNEVFSEKVKKMKEEFGRGKNIQQGIKTTASAATN